MVLVTDFTGKEVVSRQKFSNKVTIDMSKRSAGPYVIKIYHLVNKEQL